MSWLASKRAIENSEARKLIEKRKEEWGFTCGYCGKTFKDDLQALENHDSDSVLCAQRRRRTCPKCNEKPIIGENETQCYWCWRNENCDTANIQK
ncbi:MAG: hypothetical protein GTN97_07125 [Nitrosopumilaceae archaeon]|nr:hypothetical protein [Nitrosopumilaceae archaeon]